MLNEHSSSLQGRVSGSSSAPFLFFFYPSINLTSLCDKRVLPSASDTLRDVALSRLGVRSGASEGRTDRHQAASQSSKRGIELKGAGKRWSCSFFSKPQQELTHRVSVGCNSSQRARASFVLTVIIGKPAHPHGPPVLVWKIDSCGCCCRSERRRNLLQLGTNVEWAGRRKMGSGGGRGRGGKNKRSR